MTDQTGAHAQFTLDAVRPAIPCKMMVRAISPSASPPNYTNCHQTVSAHLLHFEDNFFKDQTEVISPETLYKCFLCTLSEWIVEDIVIKTQSILTMWNSTKKSPNPAKIDVEHYYLARAILLRDYGSLGITHAPSTIYGLIRSTMTLPNLSIGNTNDPLHRIVQECVRIGELDEKARNLALKTAIFTLPPVEAPLHGIRPPDSTIVRGQAITSLVKDVPPEPRSCSVNECEIFDYPLEQDIEAHLSRFENTTSSAMHEWHSTVLETFSPTSRRRVLPLAQNVEYMTLKIRLIARYGTTTFDEDAYYAHVTCKRSQCTNDRWFEYDYCCNTCRRSTHGTNSSRARSWFVHDPVRYMPPSGLDYMHPPSWCSDCPIWIPPPNPPSTLPREAPIIMAKPAKVVCRRDEYTRPPCNEETVKGVCTDDDIEITTKEAQILVNTEEIPPQGADMRPRVTAITTCSILLDSSASLATSCTSNISVECNTILRVPASLVTGYQEESGHTGRDASSIPMVQGSVEDDGPLYANDVETRLPTSLHGLSSSLDNGPDASTNHPPQFLYESIINVATKDSEMSREVIDGSTIDTSTSMSDLSSHAYSSSTVPTAQGSIPTHPSTNDALNPTVVYGGDNVDSGQTFPVTSEIAVNLPKLGHHSLHRQVHVDGTDILTTKLTSGQSTSNIVHSHHDQPLEESTDPECPPSNGTNVELDTHDEDVPYEASPALGEPIYRSEPCTTQDDGMWAHEMFDDQDLGLDNQRDTTYAGLKATGWSTKARMSQDCAEDSSLSPSKRSKHAKSTEFLTADHDLHDQRGHQDDSYLSHNVYEPEDATNRAHFGPQGNEHSNISDTTSELCQDTFNKDLWTFDEKSGDSESNSSNHEAEDTHGPGTPATSLHQHVDGVVDSSMMREECDGTRQDTLHAKSSENTSEAEMSQNDTNSVQNGARNSTVPATVAPTAVCDTSKLATEGEHRDVGEIHESTLQSTDDTPSTPHTEINEPIFTRKSREIGLFDNGAVDHAELARLLSRSPAEEEMFVNRSDAMSDSVTYESCREIWPLGVHGEQRALTHSDELWMAYRHVRLARQSAAERTPLAAPPPSTREARRQDLTLIEEELGFRVIDDTP